MSYTRAMEGNRLIIKDEGGIELLSISEVMESGSLVISVTGDIKAEIAPEFEDELMAALLAGNPVAVDFSGVNYISSAGLRALLSAQQMVDELGKSSFYVKNLTKSVTEIFEANGFLDLIEIKQ